MLTFAYMMIPLQCDIGRTSPDYFTGNVITMAVTMVTMDLVYIHMYTLLQKIDFRCCCIACKDGFYQI